MKTSGRRSNRIRFLVRLMNSYVRRCEMRLKPIIVFLLLLVFSGVKAQKITLEPIYPELTNVSLNIKVNVSISRDTARALTPVPDTVIIKIPKPPKPRAEISMTNTQIIPGKPGYMAWTEKRLAETRIFHEVPISKLVVTLPNPVHSFISRSASLGGTPTRVIIYDLNIGNVLTKSYSGAVILTPEGKCVTIGGVKHLKGEGSPAKLFIDGGKDFAGIAYTLEFPESIRLQVKNGKDELVLQHFTPSPALFRLDSLGKQTINIGAMVNLDENQTAGEYSGAFSIKMSYYKDPVILYRQE